MVASNAMKSSVIKVRQKIGQTNHQPSTE